MHVQFVNPWALILLWLVPVIGIIWLAAWHLKARALDRFLSPTMRAKLCPPPQTHRFYWQWVLALLGLLLALIAASRPQWGLREETVMQRGRDLIIALDVSRSMLAQDVHPNRLQRAKADIQDLLRELRGDRAALIAFRGKAIQLCPLTTDYAYLEQALADISPESAPRGETDIGDAITKALDAFENDAGAYQAIILISDGEDLAGKAASAAESAKKKGVVIFTVGLGDPQGAKIPSSARPNEFMTYQGQDVISKLQHETLKSIAEITGGAYVPVGTANVKLDKLYRDHLSKLTTRDIEESIQRRYIERYQWFLLPAVLALLAGALLSRGRLGKRVKATQSAQATVMRVWPLLFPLTLFAGLVQAQVPQLAGSGTTGTNQAPTVVSMTNLPPANMPSANMPPAKPAIIGRDGGNGGIGRDGARRAQRLYRMGSYHEAAKAYLAAMPGQTTELQNDCLYNA
ncbi:MAG: VWA domain-containing protein, partial [Kiritimatiellaeota bacterium]|nr:VWA domain-containing protein [Kiritimatiellota bacterium]